MEKPKLRFKISNVIIVLILLVVTVLIINFAPSIVDNFIKVIQ